MAGWVWILVSLGGVVHACLRMFHVCHHRPNPCSTQPQGNSIKLDKYKDKKVILVVNVASQCTYIERSRCPSFLPSFRRRAWLHITHYIHTGGFTPQYKELQTLQDKYGDKGFLVLAFPCNRASKRLRMWGGGAIRRYVEMFRSTNLSLLRLPP